MLSSGWERARKLSVLALLVGAFVMPFSEVSARSRSASHEKATEQKTEAPAQVALREVPDPGRKPDDLVYREKRPPISVVADFVLVEKGKRQMSLWSNGKLIEVYSIRLGRNPEGAKTAKGDGKTPEGRYYIDGRNPDSIFHRSLHISYPSPDDRMRAAEAGQEPGGAIVIHGLPKGTDPKWMKGIHRSTDWTEGCIAVTNAEIEEVWDRVADGTPIEIVP